ncbi:SLOG family protein [Streptomyces sp. NPDC094034]|uniref:SLOG family protein n=1 Tax=Streptomyces sp. NPDC094034 TaxID=3155309 RepID=UPI00332966D2
MNPYRVLVTGSRDWEDEELIRHQITRLWLLVNRPFVVVHGARPTGADWIAGGWVDDVAVARIGLATEEQHPADWKAHGRAAGPMRNQLMVQLGADMCLAFIRDGSRSAAVCADLAEGAGIPTRRWTG